MPDDEVDPDDAVDPVAVRPRPLRRAVLRGGAVVTAVVALLVAGGLVAAHRIHRLQPPPVVRTSLAASRTVPGTPPVLPWPPTGQAAVAVPALGIALTSGPEVPVPIASLTKMTTAVVVLRDHPVAPGSDGPSLTVTAADVAVYEADLSKDESTVAVRVGEVLTERQALEGLLTQSANNLAYVLAVWDAGSQAAFVTKMNVLAATLGMTESHYTDASGFAATSVSSAADCLKMAVAGMAIPTFAEVVSLTSVTLPVVGTVANIVTQIGSDGVIGIKSGFTAQAGGCMVLAADREVGGRRVLVIAAVLGQPVPPAVAVAAPVAPSSVAPATGVGSNTTTITTPTTIPYIPDPLRYAGPAAEALLSAAEAGATPVVVAVPGGTVARAVTVWGGAGHSVAVVTSAGATLLAWPGQAVRSVPVVHVPPGARRGESVGSVRYVLGLQSVASPLRLAAPLPEPNWWWRLVHR